MHVLFPLAALLGGILTWTFLEYVIHRWLGHDSRTMPNFFSREHVRHHVEGNYFAPWWKKALAALGVTAGLSAVAVPLLGPTIGGAYVLGFVSSYLAYEVLHWRIHVSAGFGPYGRWARRNHLYHHCVNAHRNHGVTSPVWDLVFRTHRRPDRIRVPRSLKLTWLEDPATGGVRPELARWYELRGAGRAG